MDEKYTLKWKRKKGGKRKGEGSVEIGAVTFRFCINETTVLGYLYRVHMSVISPKDGLVLMVDGERREKIMKNLSKNKQLAAKAGKRLSELMATTEFYLKSEDEKEIKQKIGDKAVEMKGIYCREIARALNTPTARDISTAEAFCARGEKFIGDITKNCSEGRAKMLCSRLEGLCNALSYNAMSEIAVKDIRSLQKKMKCSDKAKRQKLSLLSRFWNYCLAERITTGINPVERFRSDCPGLWRGRRGATTQKGIVRCLEPEQREKLYCYIEKHLDDGRAMSICLLSGGYIVPGMQVKLLWHDIEFKDGMNGSDVRVYVKNERNLGATKDYTRPLFRREGSLVAKRYAELHKEYGAALDDMPVVSAKNEPKTMVKTKELTNYIRDALLRAGVRYSVLAPSANQNPRIGMGVQLLQHDYKSRLLECGLETDNGLREFLLIQRISSVTADYYRSFTSPEGQRYIRRILDRWVDPMHKIDQGREPEIQMDGDNKSIMLSPVSNGYCNRLEGQITLKKGQRIVLRSDVGLTGELMVMCAGGAEVETHIIDVY